MRYFGVFVDGTNSFYTYSDPDDKYQVGDRVQVMFRGKWRSALVVYQEEQNEYTFKVLSISRKLDKQISLSKEMVELLIWIGEYYLSPFGQVLNAVIPSNLKVEYAEEYSLLMDCIPQNEEEEKILNYFKEKKLVTKGTLSKKFGLAQVNEAISLGLLKGKGKLEITEEKINGFEKITEYYKEKSRVTKNTVENKFSKTILQDLIKRKVLYFEKRMKEEEKYETLEKDIKEYTSKTAELNLEQEKVRKDIEESSKKYHLIKGVTGSGKTEVYLKLIREALKRGKGSIFLVPEISITPQMVERFRGEFAGDIAILHSRLSDSERAKEWLSLHRGEKKIVLGVRSAIFAPVKDLEYIIIDEEHETTYKQDSSPRYSAKYVGIKRGEIEGAKIVLGSATPSIETYYLAKHGVFELHELNKRYKGAKLPKLRLIDMKEEKSQFISKELAKTMIKKLSKNEQIMLLLNRKGYSTYIQCNDCGHVEECPHCSISMNYYMRDNLYKCNYCGHTKRYIAKCSSCNSSNIGHSGKGTEKLEEEIRNYFDVGVIRVDGETSREKGFYDKMYKGFIEKKYKIMLGTQIISKGLHFPDVTLVGVISADTTLNFPDFRSGERTYQLVSQVSGRAGREEKEGEVIIQTYQPENNVIRKIMDEDYEGLYNDEVESRRIMNYPPFSRLINIIISSQSEVGLKEYVNRYYKGIVKDGIEIYGPMPAPVYRIKGRYRYQIFIKGSRKEMTQIKPIIKKVTDEMKNEKIRITVDVDPINLM